MSRRSTALGLTVVIAGAVMALPLLLRKRRSRRSEDEALYETQLEQPAWSPPSYVFPIAWTASTISLAAAAQHLLLRPRHERRSELLAYLTAHTALYATFPRVYFDERSSVLAAAWTCADLLICHIAFYRALGVNRRVAAGFVPVNLSADRCRATELVPGRRQPRPDFRRLRGRGSGDSRRSYWRSPRRP